jgi:hypothetical protein
MPASGAAAQTPRKDLNFSHFIYEIYLRIEGNEILAPWVFMSVALTCAGRFDMNKSLAIVVTIAGISCATVSAHAQERLGDGAMGALAGALVAGPIGLVAGGVVGYTAGPSIASSWGLRGHRHYRRAHYRARVHTNPRPGSSRQENVPLSQSQPQNL